MHAADTIRCVESLQLSAYPELTVTVVDNGSGESVVSELERLLDPVVSLISNPENLGYGGGNNLGLRLAMDRGCDFAWVVNPDVVVDPDALRFLVWSAMSHPDAGIIGSRILYGGSEPAKIWFDGGVIDWSAHGATTHLHIGALEADHPPGEPFDVDYVTGAGMLLRRRMLDAIGLIPHDWFLYFEETDYNITAQEAGWRTLVDPRSRLHHYKRSSSRLPQPYYVYYFMRNRIRFGMSRAGAAASDVESDLAGFASAWRDKVRRHDPEWLPVYDRLVSMALADGRSGSRGARDLSEFREPGR